MLSEDILLIPPREATCCPTGKFFWVFRQNFPGQPDWKRDRLRLCEYYIDAI